MTDKKIKANPGMVLKHLLAGAPLTVGEQTYRLSEDFDLCVRAYNETEEVWLKTEISLAGFCKTVERMTELEAVQHCFTVVVGNYDSH